MIRTALGAADTAPLPSEEGEGRGLGIRRRPRRPSPESAFPFQFLRRERHDFGCGQRINEPCGRKQLCSVCIGGTFMASQQVRGQMHQGLQRGGSEEARRTMPKVRDAPIPGRVEHERLHLSTHRRPVLHNTVTHYRITFFSFSFFHRCSVIRTAFLSMGDRHKPHCSTDGNLTKHTQHNITRPCST